MRRGVAKWSEVWIYEMRWLRQCAAYPVSNGLREQLNNNTGSTYQEVLKAVSVFT
jgi:hypothetical protein